MPCWYASSSHRRVEQSPPTPISPSIRLLGGGKYRGVDPRARSEPATMWHGTVHCCVCGPALHSYSSGPSVATSKSNTKQRSDYHAVPCSGRATTIITIEEPGRAATTLRERCGDAGLRLQSSPSAAHPPQPPRRPLALFFLLAMLVVVAALPYWSNACNTPPRAASCGRGPISASEELNKF